MATYTLISSNVLASSAASVTFSAIPADYTDLVLRVSARTVDATSYPVDIFLTANSITGTSYSMTNVEGYSNSAGSQRLTSTAQFQLYYSATSSSMTSNTFASTEIYIPSYTASQNKPMSAITASPQNATTNVADAAFAGLFRNTSAITSLNLAGTSSFVSGSSFYLYGISNA